MKENTEVSSRLQKMLDYIGINAPEFATKLGYNRPQTIYDIINGKAKPSFDFFHKLENSEYSDLFNYKWIIGGNGEMLRQETLIKPININRKTKDAIIDNQEVPFLDFTAAAGLKELFDSGTPHKVLQTIKIPNLPKCDGAINVTGDSMYPLLKSGDIILYKQIAVENIFYGEMYLLSILTDGFEEYVTVKYVQRSEFGNDYVKLVSQNHHHQPKDFKISDISAIALVKASVRFNTMS